MVLEIIPLDMAFDVSKYPFCNIEKWTTLYDGTECDIVCNDSLTTNYNHQR